MKFDNQLRYAAKIIEEYDGRMPLSAWLKDFYRTNKQMGSRDRKTVSEMVYGYYRLGHNEFPSIPDRIKAYINISDTLPEVKAYFFPKGEEEDKISYEKIFPFKDYLSEGIDPAAFSKSFLTQPDLFIRVRPGNKPNVIEKLVENGINYTVCEENCISFPNGTKIETVLDVNREVVIQDRSSQRTGHFLQEALEQIDNHPAVWDCCAASGGKSIMAYDIRENIQLTVSDIRKTIIDNLIQRFQDAGILNYESFVADVTSSNVKLSAKAYDLVIADVPCSGSGTWARTPEQLYFFIPEKIKHYSNLQKNIVSHILPSMKENSLLLYITCSVFADENEKITNHITTSHSLKLLHEEIIKGYNDKADTLYAALFTNRSV
jgi:16S rRNA (cytosine967-C5)-methyltransferase